MKRILVIEDQEGPWENFLLILVQICKIAKENIERARWYAEAEEKIRSGQYDIIFLDHRMPYDDPHCTDNSDFDRFCGQLDNIGYSLLSQIETRQPAAVIVGTSSLSRDEIGSFRAPERKLVKMNMFDELPELMKTL